MKLLKKIIALVAIFAITTSLFLPVASAEESIGGIFTDLASALGHGLDNKWNALFDDERCSHSSSPNGYHNFIEQQTIIDGKMGVYYICEYCGETAGSAFTGVYGKFTSELPAQSITSSNTLKWQPKFSDVSDLDAVKFYGSRSKSQSLSTLKDYYNNFYWSQGDYSLSGAHSSSSSFTIQGAPRFSKCELVSPFTGYISISDDVVCTVDIVTSADRFRYSFCSSASSRSYVCAGDVFSIPYYYRETDTISQQSVYNYSCSFKLPSYYVTLDDFSSVSSYYDNSTRMGNVNFDFGVTNEDNSITNVTNNYIVNEGDNIYTNPVTGTTTNVTNWTYDYGDRSYNLTLEGGDTTTVTYGDEYVTINEYTTNENGDTITNNYTVYYVITTTTTQEPSSSVSTSSGLSRVFQNFGNKITQHYGNDGHNGVDVIPTSGVADTVIAHSEGEVVAVQTGQVNDTSATGAASWGNYVKVAHPNGMYTLYAHLDSVAVKVGDTVYRGQPLGLMGDTGRAFGAHLHFEVYEDETTRINPEPYLNADLPGLETEEDGWTWWKRAWTEFRLWFSDLFDNSGSTVLFEPGVDSSTSEEDEDSEWSFVDLLKAVVDGVWKFIKGIPGAIFGGLSGLIEGFTGIGDFFDAYDNDNPDGVFNVLSYGGDDLWD